jgi:oligopeptide/dipeptide ABC transporter ATP-binding protein
MYAGEIVEYADVYSLFKEARHPYTRGLLKSNLSPDERAEQFESIEGEVPNLIYPPSGCRFHPRCEQRMDVCDKNEPSLFKISDGHSASCWLLEERL